jgi:hypothetical protein
MATAPTAAPAPKVGKHPDDDAVFHLADPAEARLTIPPTKAACGKLAYRLISPASSFLGSARKADKVKDDKGRTTSHVGHCPDCEKAARVKDTSPADIRKAKRLAKQLQAEGKAPLLPPPTPKATE